MALACLYITEKAEIGTSGCSASVKNLKHGYMTLGLGSRKRLVKTQEG